MYNTVLQQSKIIYMIHTLWRNIKLIPWLWTTALGTSSIIEDRYYYYYYKNLDKKKNEEVSKTMIYVTWVTKKNKQIESVEKIM